MKLKINLWKIIIVFLLFLFFAPFLISILQFQIDSSQVELSQLLTDIKSKKVEEVVVQDQKLIVTYNDGETKHSTKEPSISFSELLDRSGIDPTQVNYVISDQSLGKIFGEVIGLVLPILLMAGLFLLILRSQNRGVQDIFSFGKSRARLFAKGKQDITFADVAGVDEAKKELEEIVDFLKNPAKYRAVGARTPKGVLLFGPSGVGKTLLAKAVAGETGVPFFSMAGSEFMEMLVGVGASRVRDLFAQAKAQAPAIIFIDEIDAIGRQRGRGFVGGHDEREQTLNQILVEMDGFTPNDNVIVVAATNRGDLLDPALLRPGRFDRRITLDMPDKEGRLAILKIHSKNKKFVESVNWDRVADRTVGFSGADLENMLNEAAIYAARNNKKEVNMEDIEEAATKVKLGPAKKRLQSEEDRKITAYHEAGHAIVTHFLPKMDPVHRISIVARGMSLGHTLIPPAADRTHETKSRLMDQIAAMLGGRAAEKEIFDEMTSGASNDIVQATRLARAMVIEFGMSELGPINFGPQSEISDMGAMEWYEGANLAPSTQEKVDNEVKKLIDFGYRKAAVLVKKHKKLMDKVVERLMEKETLDREEFEKIVGKKENGESFK
ncbi:cell division protein FtsH [Candidatus Woesebacteria bacterium RIFCSPHIGHO2_02_FULL_42_20]|uniref:ATP-dependent zinc metalloprotease FtsH n=1 Tax=Candidatus Woesebacteria bacterium RIFCSPHIGHO2_12_FULL_41_24 TaxID=1802510 RepID=A0A1F8ATM5_9BACT|nr:MAG: cell division protein FtsH [Candidatus Woesebacteria bacterium RBG_16_41_13]OGM30420.1 MAG: cell division protein FtsH [Candidatus Woesebacteria bacterium RIFCSPHIGHO2_01_FULL_42_80]OGM35469.1 MAG: cell division protein FtsH [Candidatus Woesebacteria bacterium RIFCSPHIGHO2_02_FULL_42_20]OGM55041.1 MAG: cell division protein FtsH [Candidatus Woesebacteria bacterium RIFCSPHIGHO2_12_FULL_41_24]OGM66387.1 MAG: cell division protein FtsH [Candidatus Woesebacteria bacterium RIFCSPLOWO2_01_FUL